MGVSLRAEDHSRWQAPVYYSGRIRKNDDGSKHCHKITSTQAASNRRRGRKTAALGLGAFPSARAREKLGTASLDLSPPPYSSHLLNGHHRSSRGEARGTMVNEGRPRCRRRGGRKKQTQLTSSVTSLGRCFTWSWRPEWNLLFNSFIFFFTCSSGSSSQKDSVEAVAITSAPQNFSWPGLSSPPLKQPRLPEPLMKPSVELAAIFAHGLSTTKKIN